MHGRADRRTERAIVMALVALVIVARSAIFVFWEHAHFDSDQAVIGLMGKHLSEGRALPMFLYGQNYIFAVEAWMAAAVFLVIGVSVAALKLPLLAINVAVGLLLVWLLEQEAHLSPRAAAVAAVFFVLPPPATSALLVEANGGNLEPFLYILLMWITRRRPAWCGVIFAIGSLQREFIVYGAIGLFVIGAADGVLFSRDGVRRVMRAARTAAEVWLVVFAVRAYSTPAGPGTSVADIRGPSNNVRELMTRLCFDLRTTTDGVRVLVTEHWARLFGLVVEPLYQFSIESRVAQGIRGAWLLLTAAMLLAVARGVTKLASNKTLRREHYFCAYLTLVGVVSAGSFVLARCGAVGPLRYALLSILGAVGMGAWYLQVEDKPRLRVAWIGLVTAWALVGGIGHARLWSEYARRPPFSAKRELIRQLQARHVRYAVSDYWIAYYVSFLTNEQIIMKSEDFPRIYEYDRQVDSHQDEAVRVSRTPCAGGDAVAPGVFVCP